MPDCLCGCGLKCKKKWIIHHNLKIHHFIGGPWTEERKIKWAEKMMGNTLTKGKILSNKHKQKISEGLMGNTFTKGHILSEDHKRKISQRLIGNTYTRGRIMPEDERKKRGEVLKRVGVKTRFKKGDLPMNNGHKKFSYTCYDGKIIKMRSSYEIKYAQYLDSQNYIWYYEPKGFLLSTRKYYVPDFFVESLNEWHEVKGYLRKEAKEKIELFKAEYSSIKFILLFFDDLKKLELESKK